MLKRPITFWLLSITALAVVVAPLSAQQKSRTISRNMLPASLLPDPVLTPEEKATIARAKQDLQSSNSELRLGAVMLLGKYDARDARMAVIEALSDPHERVRRAALVSVGEWNRSAPTEAVVPVLRLIGDNSAELRRMASSAIPVMMAVRRSQEMLRPGVNATLPPEIRKILIEAYLDGDVVVRRNLLANHFYLNLPVPGETFLVLMDDEDNRVRMEAVGLAARFSNPKQFGDKATEWAETGDRIMRLSLTRELAINASPAQLELLRQLTEDEDDEIATEALLARFRQLGSRPVFQQLMKRLQADRMKQEQAVRFIQLMRIRSEDAAAYISVLTQLDDPLLRREGVRLFFDLGFATNNPKQVSAFLKDPSAEIRAVAIDHLESRQQDLKLPLMEEMLVSDYPDVRLALVKMLRNVKRPEAEPLLLDLLLDDQTDIRQQSLREIVARSMDGWQDILIASLDDPDFQLQRQAVDLLMRRPLPEANAALVEFVKANPKSPLTPLIRIHLKRQPASKVKETM